MTYVEGSPLTFETQIIVKRDGRIVPFRRARIFKALESAFRDTKKIDATKPLVDELHQTIEQLVDLIVEEVRASGMNGKLLTVEGIQDLVEKKLMEHGHHDVARDYIIYREQHRKIRTNSLRSITVQRRDGLTYVRFNPMKITSAIERGFRDTLGIMGPTPPDVIDAVNEVSNLVIEFAIEKSKTERILHIEMIQDEIERQLMQAGHYNVAKDFILYRAAKAEEREREGEPIESEELVSVEGDEELKFRVIRKDGSEYKLNKAMVRKKIAHAAKGYNNVNIEDLVEHALANFYDGIKEHEVDLANIMAARAKIEIEPDYTYVAAGLLLDIIYRETMGVEASHNKLKGRAKKYFKDYFKHAVSIGRLDPALLTFDLEKLSDAIDLSRDHKFNYLGLQTLYDRYFIHEDGRRLETPQIFWMRVAMGVSLNEGKQKEQRAIEFYNILSSFQYLSGTPTLFNSGSIHSQLSSCYLSTVMDDLCHIYKVISDDAQLSKWAGGLGNDWTNVRATGSVIQGTNGKSQGVIPFLKVANDTAVAVNQCFHPDTRVFTSTGVQPIANISVGDLVLGISGRYREVTHKFVYNQHDPMVEIDVKHSLEPIKVTAGHPFYVIRGVPMEQAQTRTRHWLEKGKIRAEWVEAGQLQRGDLIAQVIPQETVVEADLTEEDARLYGILLGDGHLAKTKYEWGVSGNPQRDDHLQFVREYLSKRNIHFWESKRGDTYLQIRWAAGLGVVREATTGRFVCSEGPTLPFEYEDIYDNEKRKHIAPRFAHLPLKQALALLQGLLETDGNVSRGKEITFSNTSLHLIEDIRYQLLRFGIPSAGNLRIRNNDHESRRSDGSKIQFKGTTYSYDLRIPAFSQLAEKRDCQPVTKSNWLIHKNLVFSRIKSVQQADVVPFVCDLKVEGDESYMTTAGLAHNGGKRKGAMCAYLESWHLDIEDFLELRKNTGDERRRTHDMNTANWIPDLFMKRVMENGKWTLFSPSDVTDLHHLYGKAFEKRYVEYEKMAERGEIRLFKQIEALSLWRKMLSMLFETGHPWITFKDPSNIRSPQDHAGVVHSSNLCTEILLNTSVDETAVCNLGSINLNEHVTAKGIDRKKLEKTIETAIRMLDNVIDINYYPTPEAKQSNLRHRPIGLGIMGFQDALYKLNISYASTEAVDFSDESMELISYYAILSSSKLAKERGSYSSYKGSKWDRGLLPIDTIALLAEERGDDSLVQMDNSARLDWTAVRESIKKHGMRNSNTMAIAPTATIANIAGVTQSIEPMYKHLFVKSNLSGEFTVLNPYLIEKLKESNLWNAEMLDDLKYFDGSLHEIESIPDEVKRVFLTAFDIDPEWIIECASRRQKWIDMGQSLNLYIAEPSGKKLSDMYVLAWKKGLKTTYYLRSMGATHIEKSTTDINKRALQPRWMKNESASARVKVARGVCKLDEGCESCQ